MPKDMKSCPFCGVDVKKSNFDKHVRKVHADLDNEELEKEGLARPHKDAKKKEREARKKEEIRRQEKKRELRWIAIGIVLIVIISVVGVFVYENLTKGSESGGGTIPNGGGGENGNPVAVMVTSMGTIKIELFETEAPGTAGNFIGLVKNGFYDGTIFHRVVADFVIQGGGHNTDGSPKNAAQIPWENTGFKNEKYTISMARSGSADNPDDSGTATSQFFINLKDNTDSLDSPAYPYVVFGRVIEGQNVVDAIGKIPTGNTGKGADWPDNPPVVTSVTIQE
jgi:cyclophilin family peptidyl-prolyl cis-trans isomerase